MYICLPLEKGEGDLGFLGDGSQSEELGSEWGPSKSVSVSDTGGLTTGTDLRALRRTSSRSRLTVSSSGRSTHLGSSPPTAGSEKE